MIGSIKGKVTWKNEKFAIIEAGGVGYKVSVGGESLLKTKTGSDALFYVHTHVREDSLDLYGFETMEELEFFELLIGVSGIGPKGAITILNVASINTLKKAVNTGDTSYLTKISGIGRKTAEKMIIELRDKVGKDENDASLNDELDALEALKSLGYSQNEARDALKKVTAGTNTNTKLKEALKILGGK